MCQEGKKAFLETWLKNKKGVPFGLPYKAFGIWSIAHLIANILAESGVVDLGSAILCFGVKETKQE